MFDIVYAALPRYFYTQFNTDVENLHITLDGATEKLSPTETKVTCDRAKFIYTYKNQCQVSLSKQIWPLLLTLYSGRMSWKVDGILGRVRENGMVAI